jgi:hypothetical protein
VIKKVVNARGPAERKVNHTLMGQFRTIRPLTVSCAADADGFCAGVQLLYTFLTILPIPFLYMSRFLHTIYLLFFAFICIHNGAGYYFESFSRKYIEQVKRRARSEAKDEAEKELSASPQPSLEKSSAPGDATCGAPGEQATPCKVSLSLDTSDKELEPGAPADEVAGRVAAAARLAQVAGSPASPARDRERIEEVL